MSENTSDPALNAVSDQYYNALVFHAENEVEVSELWMLGIDPIAIADRALTAERFDPAPCDTTKRVLGICECPTCKRSDYQPYSG